MRKLLLLLVVLLPGCKTRDGDLLGQIFHRTGQKTQTALGGASTTFANRVRGTLTQIGIADRVVGRLRWDRYLEDVNVQVETVGEGVIRIEGTVADSSTKQRLLDLARATTGVVSVEDSIRLPEEK